MTGKIGQTGDWDRDLRQRSAAITVAKLAHSDGVDTCRERWPGLHPRTIQSLIRQGQKQLERRNGP